MIMLTKEFKQFLNTVAFDFSNYASGDYIKAYEQLEKSRQKEIKKGIIALVKIYKDIPLNEGEKELLNLYSKKLINHQPYERKIDDFNDPKNKLIGLICCLSFEISLETFKMAISKSHQLYDLEIKAGRKHLLGDIFWNDLYERYIELLKAYVDNILYCSLNLEISFCGPYTYGELIEPKIDFDNNCFIFESLLKSNVESNIEPKIKSRTLSKDKFIF